MASEAPRRPSAFQDAVEDVLRSERIGGGRVRILSSSRNPADERYVCHLYVGSTGVFVQNPDWVWLSPPVSTPQELRQELTKALGFRRSGIYR